MSHTKFVIAFSVVFVALSGLVFKAIVLNQNAVVTVAELVSKGHPRNNIRLGARVADDPIDYRTERDLSLTFFVRDIVSSDFAKVKVEYRGMMPDTLASGRDVILEGNYADGVFSAKTLLTQCPSKYEPPLPGGSSESKH